MAQTYPLEVISPERILLDTEVISLSLMGEDGSLSVLARHAPIVTPIVPCRMTIRPNAGQEDAFAIGEGFLEVSGGRARVLVDSAERSDEIDVDRAQESKQRAEERLARRGLPDVDYVRAEVALRRAVARLKTVGRL